MAGATIGLAANPAMAWRRLIIVSSPFGWLCRLHFAFGLEGADGLAERVDGLLDLRPAMRRRDEAAGCAHHVDAVGHQAHADLAGERTRTGALQLGEADLVRIEPGRVDVVARRVGVDQEGRGLAVDAPRHALLHQ